MKKNGSVMLFFLITLSICAVIAILGFQSAVMFSMASRTRLSYHQKVNLVEGLLQTGLHVCNAHRTTMACTSCDAPQTIDLTFDPWPSAATEKLLGHYTGLISITALKGMVAIKAQLLQGNRIILTGRCSTIINDKSIEQPLRVESWSIGDTEATI